MAMRKLLLLLKPFHPQSDGISCFKIPQVLHYLENRSKVHKDTINICQEILRRKPIHWKPILRNELSEPIDDVDMVVTVGGDGTLLHASHFLDDSVPILGVNSDPTQAKEVREFSNQFDASRSTGHLCAATAANFEQVLDNILNGRANPSSVSRLSMKINSKRLPTYALNDILVAHPCPAAVSRFSFKIKDHDNQPVSRLMHCRCSGLRVCTATGSTAAMLSAGGSRMPILSKDLQYMVREPISAGSCSGSMHGMIKPGEYMDVSWFSEEGFMYIDGSHVRYTVRPDDTLEISSDAPVLKVFLPCHLLA